MNGYRAPIWKDPDFSWRTQWEERWGMWIAGPLDIIAVVSFLSRVAPLLSGELLFYLKLGSFIITATLGVVGVVSDFKDAERRLTRSGKLNLAGLVLAAIIGVVAQKVEDDNSRRASEQAKEAADKETASLKRIITQNESVIKTADELYAATAHTNTTVAANLEATQRTSSLAQNTLQQVQRSLEPLRLAIGYDLKLPVKVSPHAFSFLRSQIAKLAVKGHYQDDQTDIMPSTGGGVTRYTVEFSPTSILIRPDAIQLRSILEEVPFTVEFSQGPTRPYAGCEILPEGSYRFVWDRKATIEDEMRNYDGFGPRPTGILMSFYSADDFIVQGSMAVFRSSQPEVPILYAMDLSDMYMRINLIHHAKSSGVLDESDTYEDLVSFGQFVLLIGQHVIQLKTSDLRIDKCGGFTFHIPELKPLVPEVPSHLKSKPRSK